MSRIPPSLPRPCPADCAHSQPSGTRSTTSGSRTTTRPRSAPSASPTTPRRRSETSSTSSSPPSQQRSRPEVRCLPLPSLKHTRSLGGPAEQIGAVESVKAASDIFAPVSGAISEINDALEASPGLLNQSPEADGTLPVLSLPREPKLTGCGAQAGWRRSRSATRPSLRACSTSRRTRCTAREVPSRRRAGLLESLRFLWTHVRVAHDRMAEQRSGSSTGQTEG